MSAYVLFETKMQSYNLHLSQKKKKMGALLRISCVLQDLLLFQRGESHQTRGEGNFFDDDEEEYLEWTLSRLDLIVAVPGLAGFVGPAAKCVGKNDRISGHLRPMTAVWKVTDRRMFLEPLYWFPRMLRMLAPGQFSRCFDGCSSISPKGCPIFEDHPTLMPMFHNAKWWADRFP